MTEKPVNSENSDTARPNYRKAPVCWSCQHGHFKRGGSGVANRQGVCMLASRPFPGDWHPTLAFWVDQAEDKPVLRDLERFATDQAPYYLAGHNQYMRPEKVQEEHAWLLWIEELEPAAYPIGWNQVCDLWQSHSSSSGTW